MNIKKLCSIYLLLLLLFQASNAENFSKDWIDTLKNIFPEDYHSKGKIDNLRENKFPGEVYIHCFTSSISGVGKVVTKRAIDIFNTEEQLNLHHSSQIILLEKVISTEKEINEGILKSEITVQGISETLKSATGKIKVGVIDSATVFKAIKFLSEHKYFNDRREEFEKNANLLIITGSGLILLDPLDGIGTMLAGYALKHGIKLFYDKIPQNIDEDGNIKLSQGIIKFWNPNYSKAITRIKKVSGTKISTVWEWDKGYTSIKIKAAPNSMLSRNDEEFLAKLIYRTNPVGGSFLIPTSYQKSSDLPQRWNIDITDIAGMLTNVGIDYDNLEGIIPVRNRGITYKVFEEENKINSNSKLRVLTLSIDQTKSCKISFKKTLNDTSTINAGIKPQGNIDIVLSQVNSTDKFSTPLYVRKAQISGSFEGEIVKDKKSLLSLIKLSKSSMDVDFNYYQLRQTKRK